MSFLFVTLAQCDLLVILTSDLEESPWMMGKQLTMLLTVCLSFYST